MTTATHTTQPSLAGAIRPLLGAASIGGAVALALGVYGKVHAPTGQLIVDLGFSSVLTMKVWLATGAALLAIITQTGSALWMWEKLPSLGTAPAWVPTAHRWSGTVAFLLTLPVAYHCLWSLGFQDTDARVLTHSLFGCAFYGALVTKLLVLRSDRMPHWAVPTMGGILVAVLTGAWFTSALWFFTTVDSPGF